MAVPQGRKSPARVKRGRSPKTWSFKKKVFNQVQVKCFNCQKTKILHHVCSHCSVYRTNLKTQD